MQAYIEKEDSKKLKQKQRERMQPKMGKMDIDYQVSFVFAFGFAPFALLAWFLFTLVSELFSSLVLFIGCQVLHDAFFKYQTKPKLTSLGDLYHEGKEFEVLPTLQ